MRKERFRKSRNEINLAGAVLNPVCTSFTKDQLDAFVGKLKEIPKACKKLRVTNLSTSFDIRKGKKVLFRVELTGNKPEFICDPKLVPPIDDVVELEKVRVDSAGYAHFYVKKPAEHITLVPFLISILSNEVAK